MKKNTKTSAFQELINSIHFAVDSKKGKYSLESYLEILGEYTDRVILSAKQEGFSFTGGTCSVFKSKDTTESLIFSIKIFFRDRNGAQMSKEAQRTFPADKFTRGAVLAISSEALIFNIEEPKG